MAYTALTIHAGVQSGGYSTKDANDLKTVLDAHDSTIDTLDENVTTLQGYLVKTVTTVDASAGGTAQATNCTLVPAGSVLIGVEAVVATAFNWDATTTCEVGVSGNADAYIDTSDFDPSAAVGTSAGSNLGTNNDIKYPQYLGTATQLIATWTNTASATAGSITVTTYHLVL